MYSFAPCLFAIYSVFVFRANADCYSFGVDFVDGGGPYFINTDSSAWFDFGTEFEGCEPSDSQGDITPILIDPNGDEYFCSNIPTTPSDTDQISTCNVPGNEMAQNQMFSGEWIVIVEGLTFAWMRTFTIVAGPQATVIATPTAVFNLTKTPIFTTTYTNTSDDAITIPASTVTLPLTTITEIITKTPSRVTVTDTLTSTRTRTKTLLSATSSVSTKTVECCTQAPRKDPQCTIFVSKASLLAASITPSSLLNSLATGPGRGFRGGGRGWKIPDIPFNRHLRRDVAVNLRKRTADLPTTTIVETTYTVTINNTFTAPTSTETDYTVTTTTTTIIPPQSTAYFGNANTTVTVTVPTPTKTKITVVRTTTLTSTTVWATVIMTTTIIPSGVMCLPTPQWFL